MPNPQSTVPEWETVREGIQDSWELDSEGWKPGLAACDYLEARYEQMERDLATTTEDRDSYLRQWGPLNEKLEQTEREVRQLEDELVQMEQERDDARRDYEHDTHALLDRASVAEAKLEQMERERDTYKARADMSLTTIEGFEAKLEQMEAVVSAAEDFRAEIVIDAFTAPDADWNTILDSLRARMRDLTALSEGSEKE